MTTTTKKEIVYYYDYFQVKRITNGFVCLHLCVCVLVRVISCKFLLSVCECVSLHNKMRE